jgi:HlyD family secretion protein
MTATVEIQTRLVTNTISVPIQAVTTRKDTLENSNNKKVECVFKFENKIAKFTKVKTGIQNDKFIEILQGLSDSDLVITGPYSLISKNLRDGTKVERKEIENKEK